MKKRKIGILGMGVVGSAVNIGLSQLGHLMSFYDPKIAGSQFSDILDTEVCFLCVPTPSCQNSGECDVTIVEKSFEMLEKNKYSGVVVIKSTVVPGTTECMRQKYTNLEICFVPEFLRERCAMADFIQNHDLCLIGTDSDGVYDLIKQVHGYYPKAVKMVSPTEAELVKYYNNIYNATLITLANSFYEVCTSLDADYSNVKESLVLREHINDSYLQCSDNFRGFGGVCLPKDTLAIAKLVEKQGLNVQFFKMILEENKKYKITVYDGMRK